MQTKQQIQSLLASAGVNPNHRRGQNFLIDLNLLRLLLNTATVQKTDIVLEVGTGTGSMTEELCKVSGKVIAVEIDTVLSQITAERTKDFDNIEIFNTDVLENKNTIDRQIIEKIKETKDADDFYGRFILISNLPYSVATPVMINLVTGNCPADEMYVTIQKEVAERMTAEKGGKHYGPLSIFLHACGEVKFLRTLKPSVFWPAPEVDSAMVSFVRDNSKVAQMKNIGIFADIVHLFMQHRRKTIQSCSRLATGRLEHIRWHDIFSQCRADPHWRPDEVLVEEFISIANLCFEQTK
ncbi:MAG: 16S rRNA (adenine(1518)-N(6)/adenine(1519)-N(6))-dimethyltransferase RsmA [Phycisphaerae bacterium]|nr:16S rRNA (adenine(1518)-N(6)/adenine(1519)-N(6))-dimethyltransferase RsmA [Phycisphaerae bacterium]